MIEIASKTDAARSVTPDVSVVIATYNDAAFLSDAIESALSQTGVTVEVVVVDDASTDATPDLIARWAEKDPRIVPIRRLRNAGQSAGRNEGIARAQGRWIAILDGDDRFEGDRLHRLLSGAEAGNFDLVADNQTLVFADGSSEPRLMLADLRQDRTVDIGVYLRGNLPKAGLRVEYSFLKPMIRRDFLLSRGLRYDEGIRFGEDYDFLLNCLLASGRFLLVPYAGYRYLVRRSGLTAEHTLDHLKQLRSADQRALDLPEVRADRELTGLLKRHLSRINERIYWRLFIEYVKSRNYLGAMGCLTKDHRATTHIIRQCMLETRRRYL